MQNNPLSQDIIDHIRKLEKRISSLESRQTGSIYLDEQIIMVDPNTGVKTVIGDLSSTGEDRVGVKEWINDTEPPAVPSDPIVTASPGFFSIVWDGTNEGSLAQAPDFSHINVYGSNGTSSYLVGVIKNPNELAIFANGTSGEIWTFWLTSIDYNGNESVPGVSSPPIEYVGMDQDADVQGQINNILNKLDTTMTAATAAQTTADGKNSVWRSATKPKMTGNVIGDIWFDTANGNRINTWNGIDWVPTRDADIESALNTAVSANSMASSAWGNAQSAIQASTAASSAASSAITAANAAQLSLDKLWSTSTRSFFYAGDRLDTFTSTSGNWVITPVPDGISSTVARKTGLGGNIYWDKTLIPFDPTALYRIRFRMRAVQDSTNATPHTLYAGVHAWDASKNVISNAGALSNSNAHYFAAGSETLLAIDGWRDFTGYFQGYGTGDTGNGGEHFSINDPGKMHPNTRYITPMALTDFGNGNGIWDVASVSLDVIPAEQVQAVLNATNVAASASNVAASAASAAMLAQSTADGKNTVWYTSTMPPGTGHRVGDLWFNPSEDNKIYRWEGAQPWTPALIGSGAISSNSITTNHLIAGAVTASKIAANSVTASAIAANSITASAIAAGSIGAVALSAEAVTATAIAANAISAEKLLIGDFNNLIPNGNGGLGPNIGWPSSLIYDSVDKPSGLPASFKSTAGQGTVQGSYDFVPVEPNNEYVFEIWIKADKPNSKLYIELRDPNGNHAATVKKVNDSLPYGGSGQYPIGNQTVPTSWTKYYAVVTPNAGVTKARIAGMYFNHSNGTERGAVVSLAGASLRRRSTGELIVDGAITTKHMTASSIDASVLSASSITGNKIAGNTITGGHIAANTISVDNLLVTSMDNLIENGGFDATPYDSSWVLSSVSATSNTASTHGGTGTAIYHTSAGTAIQIAKNTTYLPVDEGSAYSYGTWFYVETGNVSGTIEVRLRNQASTILYTHNLPYTEALGKWYRMSNTLQIPSGTTSVSLEIIVRNITSGRRVWVDDSFITRAMDSKLIVDGSVKANHIAADSIVATAISATAFLGKEFYGGTFTGGVFQTDSLPDQGMKINTDGFIGYDTEGTPTLKMTPGAGIDFMGFYGSRIHEGQVIASDGYMYALKDTQNYVFFNRWNDIVPISLNDSVTVNFDAVSTQELNVQIGIYTYPNSSSTGDTTGIVGVFSGTFPITMSANSYSVTIPISAVASPAASWRLGIVGEGGYANADGVQDKIGVKNISVLVNGVPTPIGETEQLAGIDDNGGISSQTLSVAGQSRFDGVMTIGGDPLTSAHGSGEYGPVVNGRDLVGASFTDFVINNPNITDNSSWMSVLPFGMISRGYSNTTGLSVTNQERELLELMYDASASKAYVLHITPFSAYLDGGGTYGYLNIYATRDGSRPRMSSPMLHRLAYRNNNASSIMLPFGGSFYDLGTGTTRLLITMEAVGGSMTVFSATAGGILRAWVEDIGVENSDTGVVRTGVRVNGGTAPAAPVTPPPDPLKTYTKTFTYSWSEKYKGNNTINSYSLFNGKAVQGYSKYSPSMGSMKSLIGFPSMASTLSGATVVKIEVYCYSEHWYSNSGGVLSVGVHSNTSKPGTFTVGSGAHNLVRKSMKKPDGQWITLPSSTYAGFKSGSYRGIVVSAPNGSTSSTYYGYLTASKTKLKVTYKK